jgi:hypothetical protein
MIVFLLFAIAAILMIMALVGHQLLTRIYSRMLTGPGELAAIHEAIERCRMWTLVAWVSELSRRWGSTLPAIRGGASRDHAPSAS